MFALTSLVVNYRATLEYFQFREEMMVKYHPGDFPHWMRDDRHFNLVDAHQRRVLRFESQRFIVRAEGQEDYGNFDRCLVIATNMAEKFKINDIFQITFECVQVLETKSLLQARTEFAKTFITGRLIKVFPRDEASDYSVALERTENLDLNLNVSSGKRESRQLIRRTNHLLGPVAKKEILGKWAEFKEKTDNELYKTKPKVLDFGHAAHTRVILTPRKPIKQMGMEKINQTVAWAKKETDRVGGILLGGS